MRKATVLLFVFALLCSVFIFPTQAQTTHIRVGIIGDSNSDEYRADDNRAGGTPYAETTLSWVELLAKYRDIDFGAWGKWGGERRTGYEYNWARSAATSDSMIANGQHTGLAAQVKAGKIDYAIIFIGSNDFHTWNGTYEEVYSGKLSDKQVQAKVNKIIANIILAVETLQAAGKVKIIVTNYSDPNSSADFLLKYSDADKRARVTNAINQINEGLAKMAASHNVTIADLHQFGSSILSQIDADGNIFVGSEAINMVVHGDEPHHLQLGEGVGHLGTIGSGLIANFYASALSIPTFTDAELLANAGIGSTSPAPTGTQTPAEAMGSLLEQLQISILHLLGQ
jgi:lysophospholipase L1-like esterase